MSSKTIVTGGAGFIGANLVRKLSSTGREVVVFDNLTRGSSTYLPDGMELIQGDILDVPFLEKSFGGAHEVIHLAAYGSVVESVNDPAPNFEINVRGTFNVLDAARRASAEKVIFASTGGALIGNATPPVDEGSLPKPISPYGSSKLCGEAYCHSFAKAYGLHTVCLRFANVYGPYSAHKKGAVTKFAKCLLRDEPIPIFGSGAASRDFLHVEDLCSGIVKALEGPTRPGSVFHIASAREVQILELAKRMAEIAGKAGHPIEHLPERPGEVERNFARYDKARDMLGFVPTFDFEEGLRRSWQWFSDNKDKVLQASESDA